MKLGQLKQSLSKFPPDMDEEEVLVMFIGADGREELDNLAFTGSIPDEKLHCICLGTARAAVNRNPKLKVNNNTNNKE